MNIYFSGIGGVGIGPLAEIAFDAGYNIVGSDLSESPLTDELRARGVALTIGQDGSYLRQCHENNPIDWFVHTSALPNDHPELVLAKQLGIKTAKRDELLSHIIKDKQLKLIAVAGTHGKTTTTGMLVWLFKQLNIPVSYSIGTKLSWAAGGSYDPSSQYFIYECDEFDRNFLNFNPHLSLITSIDYDHPDTFPTLDEYNAAFRQFVGQSEATILWEKDAGFLHDRNSSLNLLSDQQVVSLNISGEHNRRNASLVLRSLDVLGLGDSNTNPALLETFPGTGRRFEKLADNLYSDYGHHPVEIAATLQLASELSDYVVLVYQPHQNRRQFEIKDDYTDDIFQSASEIYWLPTYLTREDPLIEMIDPEYLSRQIDQSKLHLSDLNDDLWLAVESHRSAGHLVLFMGAGSIDQWVRDRLS